MAAAMKTTNIPLSGCSGSGGGNVSGNKQMRMRGWPKTATANDAAEVASATTQDPGDTA